MCQKVSNPTDIGDVTLLRLSCAKALRATLPCSKEFRNHDFGKDFIKEPGEKLLTFGVFGVMHSYLACVEHTSHVLRQNTSFDENYIFSVENSEF